MFRPPHVRISKTTIAVLIGVQGMCFERWSAVSAQGIAPPVTGAVPLGLRAILPSDEGTLFGPTEGLKGGFAYGLGVLETYDTNFFLTANHPESELTTNVLPWIGYYSDPERGAPFSFTARYQPNIRAYLNNSDLDGIDQSGGGTIKVEGAKTSITANLNYITVSGTDRFSGTFVSGSLLQADLEGTYQIAPRTSLFATWKLAKTDYGSDSLVGSDIATGEVGGFWAATERFSFGPSISYIKDESVNTGTRDAWALNMQARYLLANKLQFQGSLGLQYATNSRDQGNSTLGLTGNLTAGYAINDRLQWTNSVQYITVPSANDVNYVINNLTVSTALIRQLLRAELRLGLDWNLSDYLAVGAVGTQLGQVDNLSAVLSYRRKMFLDRVDFDSSIRYAMNRGNTDWDQLQITAGIIVAF